MIIITKINIVEDPIFDNYNFSDLGGALLYEETKSKIRHLEM